MLIGRRNLLQSGAALGAFLALQPLAALANPSTRTAAPRLGAAAMVVPALKSFSISDGQFRLDAPARIIAKGVEASGIAQTLSADLAELIQHDLPRLSHGARAGDIELVLEPGFSFAAGGKRFDEEGYRIDISSRVTITAPTPVGLYWGTRTLLQMLVAAPDRATLDHGVCHDWPDYAKRGFMLDVGRRFFTADFLRDYISLMSWFKLNEFQIHLMDNGFLEKDSLDWSRVQRGFRLASDNPKFEGLASPDGAYDRKTWDSIEDRAASRFIKIIPELEGPAHALSIIGWKPELGLTGKSGDHLDLSKPAAFDTMKDIFSEFVPWFRGTDVHIGADEYKADPELFVRYFNEITRHVRSLGKHPRAWGSFTMMSKGTSGYDTDVTINSWNRDWYSMASAAKDGYRFINTDDDTLYLVPFADYYRGTGLKDRELYEAWVPSIGSKMEVDPAAPLGSMWAVWNDLTRLKYNEHDVHALAELTFPVMAQKNWNASAPKVDYDTFGDAVATVGLGPGRKRVKATRIGLKGDLMLAATVTANNAAPGHPASHVNDREPATQWRALGRTGSSQLDIDLGAVARVTTVEIQWGGASSTPYVLETSADGIRWLKISRRKSASAEIEVVALPRGATRYLRLTNIRGLGASVAISRISAFAA